MNEEGVGPRGGTTPPGHGRLQLRYETGLTGEGYVRAEAWRDARLDRCPNHPHGECSLARHGTRRGLPLRLYVDNGANYRSHQLALVCAKLGIALIHARPWQPAGKGEIERFFRTLRAAWLERLDADATLSLEALNRSLWAWVEGEYHQSPHRGIDGRTPLEQWALAGENVRYPGPDLDLDDLFLFEATPAVTERFHAVGNGLCDWVWLSAGLDEPAREPWQVWPLGFDPVVYQVWTVTQREPLRVGVPAGSIWLDIDAAYDEAAMIETLHALIPPTP